jgi:hypothetical protein
MPGIGRAQNATESKPVPVILFLRSGTFFLFSQLEKINESWDSTEYFRQTILAV